MEKQITMNAQKLVSEGETMADPGRAAAAARVEAIQIAGLRAGYGAGDILKGVDMAIFEHKITAIIGPSGCGKS
ncbi:MAG: hypothetical protein JO102_02380, partial [Elusimicrobia bacterium]|nr:hypothetical protein [Elusimicrobiota bacterium]